MSDSFSCIIVGLAFVFGAIIGSFLNVVILRWNTGAPIAADRSRCFSCGTTLRWYELIPVVSFILQRGRCRTCGTPISWQYPLVETLTGLLFALTIWLHMPFSAFGFLPAVGFLDLLYLAIWALLVIIVVYDLRHKIIPDTFALVFALLGLIALFLQSSLTAGSGLAGVGLVFAPSPWIDIAAGPLLALPFYALWFFSGGRWMGLGDAKLAWGIGWFLGAGGGLAAIILGFWLGAAVGIILIILKYAAKLKYSAGSGWVSRLFRRISLFFDLNDRILKSEIPFAPFLVAGVLIIFATGLTLSGLVSVF